MSKNSLTKRVNLITIIAVYFLILVGGIVRSMGAGMGCPDWPKCFGQYVPPTNASNLPPNYELAYVESRMQKNARLVNILAFFGFQDMAQKVASDPSIMEVTFFDAGKAWVEYINRLIGVLIGLLIVLNAYFSLRFWKQNKKVTWLGMVSLVLVLFQGWVGSLVVSTNLLPGFISFHMLLALLLVCLLVWQHSLIRGIPDVPVAGRNILLVILLLFLVQIVFGIQVREQIDSLKYQLLNRGDWIAQLSTLFYIHRSYSLILVGLIAYLVHRNWQMGAVHIGLKMLLVIVVFEIVMGAIMAYFSVPAFAQPIHLLFGTLAFGLIFYLFLRAQMSKYSG